MFNARMLHQNKLSTNLKLKNNPQEHKFVFNVKLVLLSKNQSLLNLQFLLEVISKTFQALSSIITLMHLWSFLLNPPMVLKMEGLPFKFGEQISETLVMIQLAHLVRNQSQQKRPAPRPQTIFSAIGRPWRIVGDKADLRKSAREQRLRMGLADERHVIALHGGAQHRRGKSKIAEAP